MWEKKNDDWEDFRRVFFDGCEWVFVFEVEGIKIVLVLWDVLWFYDDVMWFF